MNQIDTLHISAIEPNEEEAVSNLIKSAMSDFDQSTELVSAIMRRVEHLKTAYSMPGSTYFVARDKMNGNIPVAGAGIGSFHGLPLTEGMGEVRDLVVNPDYRGKSLGTKLIYTCIEQAKEFGYKKLYLETTPQMKPAQKLFMRVGFRGIRDTGKTADTESLPSYFIMEDL